MVLQARQEVIRKLKTEKIHTRQTVVLALMAAQAAVGTQEKDIVIHLQAHITVVQVLDYQLFHLHQAYLICIAQVVAVVHYMLILVVPLAAQAVQTVAAEVQQHHQVQAVARAVVRAAEMAVQPD